MTAPAPSAPPESAFIGYCRKEFLRRPDGFRDCRVSHISSFSSCIAQRPGGWVDRWDFNAASFYDTIELADAAFGDLDPRAFAMFAYTFVPICFNSYGGTVPLETGAVFGALFPTALPLEAASFRFLGFDVVQGFDDPPHGDAAPRVLGGGFGCSPLSCNTLCLQHPVNEYCLLSEWSDAVHAAREFAKAQPEPGSYYIFGVFMMDDAT